MFHSQQAEAVFGFPAQRFFEMKQRADVSHLYEVLTNFLVLWQRRHSTQYADRALLVTHVCDISDRMQGRIELLLRAAG